MKICNKCGASLQNEAKFCSVCGNPIEQYFGDTSVLGKDDFGGNNYSETESEETTVLNNNNNTGNYNQNEKNYYGNTPVSDNTYNTPAYNNQFPQSDRPPYNPQGTAYSPNNANEKMSYLDFFNTFASKKTKSYTKTLGIICIITCVVSLMFIALGNYYSIIDFLFYLIFAVLTFKLKRWYIALPVCIYGGVFTILGFVLSGSPSGIVAFITSIFATIQLKKLEDAYNNYSLTNQFPENEI